MQHDSPVMHHPIVAMLIWISSALLAITTEVADLEIWLSVVLKLVSIFSFTLITVINLPKATRIIRSVFKKK